MMHQAKQRFLSVLKRLLTRGSTASFILYFLYTVAVCLLLQLILIPSFIEGSSNGLFVPDSIKFHTYALDLLHIMQSRGISSWDLFYEQQSPSGISALFYYFTAPEPYVLIPYHSLLHALSGLLVYKIIRRLGMGKMAAFCGGGLLVINPLALTWVAQIHRDGLFIFGCLLCLYGAIKLFECLLSEKKLLFWMQGMCYVLISSVCIGISRVYWNEIQAFVLAVLFLISLIFYLNRNGVVNCAKRQNTYVFVFIALLCVSCFLTYPRSVDPPLVGPDNRLPKIEANRHRALIVNPFITSSRDLVDENWRSTPLIGAYLDPLLKEMSVKRRNIILHQGESNIDEEVLLFSAASYLAYFPRAVQISLFAPLYGTIAKNASSSVQVLLNMAISFMGILVLAFGVLLFKACKMPIVWIIMIHSMSGALVYAYVMPNMATFMRMRYGFHALILSLGFAFLVDRSMKYLTEKNSND